MAQERKLSRWMSHYFPFYSINIFLILVSSHRTKTRSNRSSGKPSTWSPKETRTSVISSRVECKLRCLSWARRADAYLNSRIAGCNHECHHVDYLLWCLTHVFQKCFPTVHLWYMVEEQNKCYWLYPTPTQINLSIHIFSSYQTQ